MSRFLKLIASVFVLAAGSAVALATASAPAQSRSQMIVCPLEPNATITNPCCGPPIATAAGSAAVVCCGTPQPINCPLGMTLASSANPSTAGHKITLTGRWPGNAAGQTVDLWQESAGAKSFTKVASTTTGSAGAFQFVRKGVKTNRTWYASAGSEHSLMVVQQVKAAVTLGASGGRVTPNHAGERVLIERHSEGGWAVIARTRLSNASTYTMGLKRSQFGELRAVLPGDKRNIRSVSRTMHVVA
jgi:hypothetical protein